MLKGTVYPREEFQVALRGRALSNSRSCTWRAPVQEERQTH